MIPKLGKRYLCIKTVRMKYEELVYYKKGEIYKSERPNCITNIYNEKYHFWNETDISTYFLLWNGKQRRIWNKIKKN